MFVFVGSAASLAEDEQEREEGDDRRGDGDEEDDVPGLHQRGCVNTCILGRSSNKSDIFIN